MRSEFQCTPATAVRLFSAQLLNEHVAAQARTGHWTDNAKQAFTQHWPEYMIEGICLGLFMISACAFSALLEHPASPVRQALPDALGRRVLTGLAMGATAVAIIYSPLGQQSGAHFNPAVTLTFFRLGKIAARDAAFYVLAQFLGGVSGVLISALFLGMVIAHPSVHYAATRPGVYGAGPAFAAEFVISFILMLTVLSVSNSKRLARLTPLCAGALVATYITFESPISGMSMNPARTLGSALPAGIFTSLRCADAARDGYSTVRQSAMTPR